MSKHRISTFCGSSLSIATLVLALQMPAVAADQVKIIEIILGDDGFVFSEPNTTIEAGQSIKWIPNNTLPNIPHRLVPDDPSVEEFKPHDRFDASNPPTRVFPTPRNIDYHCAFHPDTMKGKITVTSVAKGPGTYK